MDLSRDELRRELRAARAEQAEARADARNVLSGIFDADAPVDVTTRADVVLGGLARRRFLRIGGLSVATAAVLAACGDEVKKSANVPVAGEAPPTTGLAERKVDDTVLLRTASSLEHNAIDAYEALLATGVLKGQVADAAKLFQDQHRQHALAAEDATRSLGGTPYTKANPVVQAKVIDPALGLIKEGGNKPEDMLWFAYGLETVAAQTYQNLAPVLGTAALRQSAARIGSTESRHVVIIAAALGAPVTPSTAAKATAASSTSSAGSTSTTAAAVEAPTIFQVPGAFSPLAPFDIIIDGQKISLDALGPNSFMYNDAK